METSSLSQTFKPLSSWTVDDVCSWIKGLDPSLQMHTPQFLAHCICGEDLVKIDRHKLDYLKVTQIGHQELLMEAVELLVALDNNIHQQTVVRRARLLSKKASQLVQLTCKPYPESKVYLQSLEKAASVMEAARSIISWLNSNPCSLVDDYESFREAMLKASLNINSAVSKEPDHCREILQDSGKTMVKLTSVLIAPQHFNAVTDNVVIVDVTLKPDRNGLGFSLCKHVQGPLQVNHVEPGSPAEQSGCVFVGDEVLQVNSQNVVGWEVPNVVECLKSNPYEVLLTIKSNMSRTPPTQRKRSNNSRDKGKSPQSVTPSARVRHNVTSDASYRHSTPIYSIAAKDALSSSEMPNGHLPLRSAVSAPPKHSPMSKQLSVGSASMDVHCNEEESTNGAGSIGAAAAALRKKKMSGSASVDMGMLRNPTPVSMASQSSEEIPVFTGQVGSECSSRTDTPDEGESGTMSRDERASSVPPKSHNAMATKTQPTRVTMSASNVAMAMLGEKGKAHSSSTGDLPSTCYRTQIIGGVVHKIPITPQGTPPASPPLSRKTSEQVFKTVVVGGVVMKIPIEKTGKAAESATKDAKSTAGPAKRPSKKKKNAVQKQEQVQSEQSPSPKSADREGENNSPNPEDEVSAHKGVFSNPKDVTISGHSTKEVEVQSQLESISSKRPDKKHDAPELMVPCFQLKDIDHEGWLQKLGGSGLTPKNWRKRWFVLKGPHLYYYKTAFDVCALGLVKLSGYTVEETADSKKHFAFHLSKEGERTYYFIAEVPEEMMRWMQVLKKASEL